MRIDPKEFTKDFTLNRRDLTDHFKVGVHLPSCRCFLQSNVEFLQTIHLIKFRQFVEKSKKMKGLLDSDLTYIFERKSTEWSL